MTARTAPVAIFGHGELIGDALYKLPFLRALRAAFPEARLIWLSTEESALRTHLAPLMTGLIDEFRTNLDYGSTPLQLLQPCPIRDRFSVLLDTQAVIWRTLLARRIRHDLFIAPSAGFRLSDRRPGAGWRKPPHVVDRLIDLLELATGHRPIPSARRLVLPADLQAQAAQALPAGPAYIGLAPGAGNRTKCWPTERYIEIARNQVAQGRVPVFLIGPAEQEWLPQLQAAVPEARFPLQDRRIWGDAFTPLATIAVAGRLSAAVANDSGISHMIAAADVPLLVLFGPTSAEKLRPIVTRGAVLKATDFRDEKMDSIPVGAVAKALENLRRGNSSSGQRD